MIGKFVPIYLIFSDLYVVICNRDKSKGGRDRPLSLVNDHFR